MKIIYKESNPIYRPSSLDSFLEISPLAKTAFQEASEKLKEKKFPREQLFKRLSVYNSGQNCPEIDINLNKIKDHNAYFVVTGQQLGLMGGPSYTIFKAITALLLAKKYKAIPLFWLATEDHDQHEIDHTYLLDYKGNLDQFKLDFSQSGQMVEDLRLLPKHIKKIDEFCEEVGMSLNWTGDSYVSAMVAVLKKLFKGTGLLFLEPHLLRDLAIPFFEKEILEGKQGSLILQETTSKLVEAGGEAVLSINNHANLFYKDEKGHRLKIIFENKVFKIGNKLLHPSQLLEILNEFPERFSTNAASRPVLQSLLIPTLAYIAGPSEIRYYRQLKAYHEFHGVSMPWIHPRHSGTMITPLASYYLRSLKIDPWDRLHHSWNAYLPELEEIGKSLKQNWEREACKHIPSKYKPEQLHSLIGYSVRKIQKRVLKKYLKEKNLSSHTLHYLRNLIHPQQKLQERVLNWFEFQRHSKINLIEQLLKQLDLNHQSHFYCYYE